MCSAFGMICLPMTLVTLPGMRRQLMMLSFAALRHPHRVDGPSLLRTVGAEVYTEQRAHTSTTQNLRWSETAGTITVGSRREARPDDAVSFDWHCRLRRRRAL